MKGELQIDAPKGAFTATAIADRIDFRSGEYRLVDYKTGIPSTNRTIKAGFDPQLPLQAVMVDTDGFKDLHGYVGDMTYLSLRGHVDEDPVKSLLGGRDAWSPEEYAEAALDAFEKLITYFDTDGTAYHSQPRVAFANQYGDYDHLARRAEWAKASGSDDTGELS